MTEESNRRAHERLDVVETRLDAFEAALTENTQLTRGTAEMTKTIADNTSELVTLVKGAKGFRKFIVWVGPIIAGGYAVWDYLIPPRHQEKLR